jgi:hypothetical protein
MERFRMGRPSPAMMVALLALFVALGSGAYAAIGLGVPDSKGVFHGCITKQGHLRVVKSGRLCKKVGKNAERAIAWNARGQKGDPGPATGPAGGDLTGRYPSPTIAAGTIGPSKFATIPAVRAGNDADQSIANATGTTLTFDYNAYDTQGLHSTSVNSDLLTAPVSGVYSVAAYALWEANATGIRGLSIKKIGTTPASPVAATAAPAADGTTTAQTVSTQLRLAAGESVEARVQQTSGGPLKVLTVNAGQASPAIEMTWIAP